MTIRTRFGPSLLLAGLFAICALSVGTSFAQAASSEKAAATGPVWKVVSVSAPTNFKPGGKSDALIVTATNVGGSSTGCTEEQLKAEEPLGEPAHPVPIFSPFRLCSASSPTVPPVTISDVLPHGLTVAPETEHEGVKISPIFGDNAYQDPFGTFGEVNDESEGPPFGLRCTVSPVLGCTTSEPVAPGDTLVVTIRVNVEAAAVEGSSEVNEATVSGGGAASASVSDPVKISSEPASYGVAPGGSFATTSTSQAGAHPNLTQTFFLNTINPRGEENVGKGEDGLGEALSGIKPVSPPKDVSFDAPPGFVGTTVGVARCTMAEVVNGDNCPRDSMVGTATVMIHIAQTQGARFLFTVPVYNIAPAPGEPAAFAFQALFFPVRLDTSVLSNGEYNVRVSSTDITEAAETYMTSVTIWGVPAEHNGAGPDALTRDIGGAGFIIGKGGVTPEILFGGPGVEEKVEEHGDHTVIKTQNESPVALLTNPSQCSAPLTGGLVTDGWDVPGVFAQEGVSMGSATGCDQLSFKPGVSMLPDTLEAGAPAGYAFDLALPQNTNPESVATPDVKKTVVTLPAGTVISPSAADGLGVCTSEQFYGPERGQASPAAPGACPRASQVGTVRVQTPALEERLKGDVYLGAPECSGANGVCTPEDAADGKMIHLYVQFASEGEGGIIVKLEGRGQINQQTGQITTVFENTPQLPFSEFELTLQGGERATLSNPRSCGEATTTADLTPWSTPYTPDATPTSSFDVNENCFGPQFNPSFSFGTTSNQAGGFSPFSVSFGRSDDDQFLNGIQVRTPPGLLGMLSKVALCGEPQAAEGTCGPESEIGETTVETGPGADPFLVTGGKVYITGPYKGAPYGLSIVVPAKAGPYTLAGTTGKGTVVVRSTINVNPETAALTVTSDPLPTELDGIPLQLKLVNVSINRPEFMFNSTSCNKMAIGGTLTDTQASSAVESSSYQVTNCGALGFKPKFTVSTSGKTSKANGAALDAKVVYPAGAQGSEADIAKVKVELPKQLPSRLTTLQKACTQAQFQANPAGCPQESVIGIAKVSTPVLRSQLTGPVYFVSNGGEAFPNLIVVLQGEGVRVDLVGDTFISKAGITSTTFKTVPDTPFNSFELYLPEGKYSALAANGNLCKSSLTMPNEFIAQNGTAIHQKTKIAVTGCPKAKKAVKKKTKKKKKKGKQADKASHGNGRQS